MKNANGYIKNTSLDRLIDLKFQCLLEAAIKEKSLRKISAELGIDPSILSKYLNKHVKPRLSRMRNILEKLGKYDTIESITECYDHGVYEFPEANNISWKCPHVYYCVLYELTRLVLDKEFTSFLTVEGGGLYIATGLQTIFPRKKLLFALRDVIVRGGYSLRYKRIPLYAYGPRIKRYLTLPIDKTIIKGEKVVIVDDFIWTGETVKALGKYAKSKGATIASIIALGARAESAEDIARTIGVRPQWIIDLKSR